VSLVPGRKWATVKGSGKASYKVNRDGCTCHDWLKRGDVVGPCKHMQAVRALCTIAKLARAEARETGRCTLPAPLGRALANGTRDQVERSRRAAELADELFGTGA
jgi:predicted nucleic acid-binding Zn finger protein